MRSTAIFFGLLSIAAASASQVAPAMPGPSASITVEVRDLNLSTDKGRADLQRRLSNAAAEVCGDVSAIDRAGRAAVAECKSSVVERATSDLALRQTTARLAAR